MNIEISNVDDTDVTNTKLSISSQSLHSVQGPNFVFKRRFLTSKISDLFFFVLLNTFIGKERSDGLGRQSAVSHLAYLAAIPLLTEVLVGGTTEDIDIFPSYSNLTHLANRHVGDRRSSEESIFSHLSFSCWFCSCF